MKKEDRKTIATYAVSVFCGIEILGIEHGIEDYISYRYVCTDKKPGKVVRAKVRETTKGRLYFRSGWGRVYLDETMRVF